MSVGLVLILIGIVIALLAAPVGLGLLVVLIGVVLLIFGY